MFSLFQLFHTFRHSLTHTCIILHTQDECYIHTSSSLHPIVLFYLSNGTQNVKIPLQGSDQILKKNVLAIDE